MCRGCRHDRRRWTMDGRNVGIRWQLGVLMIAALMPSVVRAQAMGKAAVDAASIGVVARPAPAPEPPVAAAPEAATPTPARTVTPPGQPSVLNDLPRPGGLALPQLPPTITTTSIEQIVRDPLRVSSPSAPTGGLAGTVAAGPEQPAPNAEPIPEKSPAPAVAVSLEQSPGFAPVSERSDRSIHLFLRR